jgi:hypothetical protein
MFSPACRTARTTVPGAWYSGPMESCMSARGDQGSNFLANYCNRNRAQDLPTLAEVQQRTGVPYQGKILRLNLDGSIPRDNPVLNGVRSHIYSYGHRNPQGLVFAGARLFDSEHGESIDDEVNSWWRVAITDGRSFAGYRDDQSYVYANWSASSPQAMRIAHVQRLQSAGVGAAAARIGCARGELQAAGEDVLYGAEHLRAPHTRQRHRGARGYEGLHLANDPRMARFTMLTTMISGVYSACR